MSWRTLNCWSRWLVLRASAPPIFNGTITLSSVGIRMDLRALCQAAVPELLPANGVIETFDLLWEGIEDDEQREKFVLFLEWIVLADATCARNLMSLTPDVLTPGEAWRASAPIVFAEPDSQIALALARRSLVQPLCAPATSTSVQLTQSQATAYRRISAMARAFFSNSDYHLKIQPRLLPLCVGPTGVGKTSLLRLIATENKASFLRTSAGEWVPIGVRSVRPTLTVIIEALANSPTGAVVVLIDELDKVSGETDSTWARGVLAEIYATLDRSFPLETVLRGDAPLKLNISLEELRSRIETNLFLTAAGTWQALWSGGGALGFGGTMNRSLQVLDHLAAQKIVPLELLMRFSWPPILLQYPDQAETADMFRKTGLTEFAANLGRPLDPATHDWSKGGLRSLESLAGDLLVHLHSHEPTR